MSDVMSGGLGLIGIKFSVPYPLETLMDERKRRIAGIEKGGTTNSWRVE
jgi:hypothetical protein